MYQAINYSVLKVIQEFIIHFHFISPSIYLTSIEQKQSLSKQRTRVEKV